MIIRNKTCFVYDVEVFPNFFSVAIKNTESGNKVFYQISEIRNDMLNIVKLFLNKNIYFCGYNTTHYDKPVISYIVINYKRLILLPYWEITRELKEFSNKIIESQTSASWSTYKYANLYEDLDLLTMRWSQKLRPSLKALQVTMEYPNVEEYSGDFMSFLPKDEIENVKLYNFNDVDSSEELLNRSKKDIELRLSIFDTFGINVMNQDGVNLGVEIIKHNYLKDTGKQWFQIKDLRSPCDEIDLKEILFDFIEFKTPEFQKLHKELLGTHINLKEETKKDQSKRWKKTLYINGLKITYSLGGIHTRNESEIYRSDENWLLVDSDCASMYPSAIINFNLYPRHLGPEFLTTYKKIREDRIKAKREGNKVLNETYKLALNGISGMLQSEYSWCYDPKTVLTLRLNCQLMLLMLTERLIALNCRIGQLNTDGIMYLADTQRLTEVFETCKEWEKITKFELEHEYFEAFYQYAVNDYIGVYKGYSETHDPKLIKTKGLFIQEPVLGKGMAPLIIPEALNKYFVEGISPEETIKNCKDIKKFCTFQKVAKDFTVFYGNDKVAHINRYYMSTNGKMLTKQKVVNREKQGSAIALCASSPVTIYNKFDDISIENRCINYQYYIQEAYKIIDKMDNNQLSLW